jgi:hypothetical protein
VNESQTLRASAGWILEKIMDNVSGSTSAAQAEAFSAGGATRRE